MRTIKQLADYIRDHNGEAEAWNKLEEEVAELGRVYECFEDIDTVDLQGLENWEKLTPKQKDKAVELIVQSRIYRGQSYVEEKS